MSALVVRVPRTALAPSGPAKGALLSDKPLEYKRVGNVLSFLNYQFAIVGKIAKTLDPLSENAKNSTVISENVYFIKISFGQPATGPKSPPLTKSFAAAVATGLPPSLPTSPLVLPSPVLAAPTAATTNTDSEMRRKMPTELSEALIASYECENRACKKYDHLHDVISRVYILDDSDEYGPSDTSFPVCRGCENRKTYQGMKVLRSYAVSHEMRDLFEHDKQRQEITDKYNLDFDPTTGKRKYARGLGAFIANQNKPQPALLPSPPPPSPSAKAPVDPLLLRPVPPPQKRRVVQTPVKKVAPPTIELHNRFDVRFPSPLTATGTFKPVPTPPSRKKDPKPVPPPVQVPTTLKNIQRLHATCSKRYSESFEKSLTGWKVGMQQRTVDVWKACLHEKIGIESAVVRLNNAMNGRCYYSGMNLRLNLNVLRSLICTGVIPREHMRQALNLTSFAHRTCRNSIAPLRSSILAYTRDPSRETSLYSLLIDKQFTRSRVVRIDDQYFPLRVGASSVHPSIRERFKPSRNGMIELTLRKDLGGNVPVDLLSVQPHGTTASAVPYVNLRQQIGNDEFALRMLLNTDTSCGKHTLDELGIVNSLKTGPTSMDDILSAVPDGTILDFIDTETGESLIERSPTVQPTHRIARHRWKDDKGDDKIHWSPIFPKEEGQSLYDAKAMFDNISTVLKQSISLPSKIDIPPTVEPELTTSQKTSFFMTAVLPFLTFSTSGLKVVPMIKNLFSSFSGTPYANTWDNFRKVFWTPAITSIMGVQNYSFQHTAIVGGAVSMLQPSALTTYSVRKNKEEGFDFTRKDKFQTAHRIVSIGQEPNSGEHCGHILDPTARLTDYVSTWVTKIDNLKTINDYIKLYHSSPHARSAIFRTPDFSIALKYFADTAKTSFLPYVLNHGLRMFQKGSTLTTGSNMLVDELHFQWPQVRPALRRHTQGTRRHLFPNCESHPDDTRMYHIPYNLYVALQHPEEFGFDNIATIVWQTVTLPSLSTAGHRKVFLLRAWLPSLNALNPTTALPTGANAFYEVFRDSVDLDSHFAEDDHPALHALLDAYEMRGKVDDFIRHSRAKITNFPVSVGIDENFSLETFAPVPLNEHDYNQAALIKDKILNSLPFPYISTYFDYDAEISVRTGQESDTHLVQTEVAELTAVAENWTLVSDFRHALLVDTVPGQFGASKSRSFLVDAGDLSAYRTPFSFTQRVNGDRLVTSNPLNISQPLIDHIIDDRDLPRMTNSFNYALSTLLSPGEQSAALTILMEATTITSPQRVHTNMYNPVCPFSIRNDRDSFTLQDPDCYPRTHVRAHHTGEGVPDWSYSNNTRININTLYTSPFLRRFMDVATVPHPARTPDLIIPQFNHALFVHITAGTLAYNDFSAVDPTVASFPFIHWQKLMLEFAEAATVHVDDALLSKNTACQHIFFPADPDAEINDQQRLIINADWFIYKKIVQDYKGLGIKGSFTSTQWPSNDVVINNYLETSEDAVFQRARYKPLTVLPNQRADLNFKDDLVVRQFSSRTSYLAFADDEHCDRLNGVQNPNWLTDSWRVTTENDNVDIYLYRWVSPPHCATTIGDYSEYAPILRSNALLYTAKFTLNLVVYNYQSRARYMLRPTDYNRWNELATIIPYFTSANSVTTENVIAPDIRQTVVDMSRRDRPTSTSSFVI